MASENYSQRGITQRLESAPAAAAFVAVFSSFCVYFCMYAFRKPFLPKEKKPAPKTKLPKSVAESDEG